MKPRDQKKFNSMKKASEISAAALKEALSKVKVGVKLSTLDKIAEDRIISLGAEPAFKRVPHYDYTTCINVNEGLVHGIPTDYALKKGDIVSIDLGAFWEGYNSDQCWTVEVETSKESAFLDAGKRALEKAIEQAQVDNKIGDISSAIQNEIEQQGFSVSRALVGHGVGKTLHEAPHIPCFGSSNKGKKLKEGMTIAIEVIYQKGDHTIVERDDGWTIETEDKSLSAVFEHSIGVSSKGPVVFTKFSGGIG